MTVRRIAAACLAVVVLAGVARVGAHEIGTTRVTVVFLDDRRYEIEIVTDAAALLEKLEAAAGRRAALDGLGALDEVFRQRVGVMFDAVASRPDIQHVVSAAEDGSAPVAAVRLSGEVPRDARAFTWMYSWTFASYALSIRTSRQAEPVTEWLEGGEMSASFSLAALPPPGRIATAWRYLVLGFTHIVPHGLDHMLFVIGIFLLSSGLRSVLWQVTAFTVAHSMTLGLSIYGLIAVPPAVVEPLIAISIGYVAIENLLLTELRAWRVLLVFAFGLLHGMGFAGALQELGLPRSQFVSALLGFNVGVEAGQLAVIGATFLLVGWQWSNHGSYRRRVVVPVSMLIACTAVYWTVERVAF